MLRRLKRALKTSYVGPIALGYMLAEVILYFVNAFASPFASLVSQTIYQRVQPGQPRTTGILYIAAAPDAIRFVLTLVIWFAFFYWLYLTPEEIPGVDTPNRVPTEGPATR